MANDIKQVLDIRPGKGMSVGQSDEHQRNWTEKGWEWATKHGNYDRNREHLNFEIVKGGIIQPVDKSRTITGRMAEYIEYKNKTQEKCNYCTIYQCISGFYKKNVELHLLLILAIDSLIYSFYVTILLCKKAPVFD